MAKFDDALEEEEAQEVDNTEEPSQEETEAEETKDEQEESQEEQEPEKEEAKQETEEDKQVPLKAMLAERDKRKEAEIQLQMLQKEKAALQQKREEEEEVDPDSDPAAYYRQREEKILKAVGDKILAMSVMNAKDKWSDYDEKEALFIEAAKKDPTLGQKMDAAPDPARFAYETARQLELQAKYGNDPEAWREAIRQEEREKLEQEIKGKKTNLDKARAKQPSNLNDLRAAGGNDKAGYKPSAFGDALPK